MCQFCSINWNSALKNHSTITAHYCRPHLCSIVEFFFSRVPDQQYGMRTKKKTTSLKTARRGAHQEINRSLLPCRHIDNDNHCTYLSHLQAYRLVSIMVSCGSYEPVVLASPISVQVSCLSAWFIMSHASLFPALEKAF